MELVKNLQRAGLRNGKTESHMCHRTFWGLGGGKHNRRWKSFNGSQPLGKNLKPVLWMDCDAHSSVSPFPSTASTSRTSLENKVSASPWLFSLPLLPPAPAPLYLSSSSSISFPPQHTSVIYSAVKTQLPEDSAGEVRSQDEDAIENYENVQFAWLVPDAKLPAQCHLQGFWSGQLVPMYQFFLPKCIHIRLLIHLLWSGDGAATERLAQVTRVHG